MKFFEKRKILNIAEYCDNRDIKDMFPAGEYEFATSERMSGSDIVKDFGNEDMYPCIISCKLVLKDKEVKNAWVDIGNEKVVFSDALSVSMSDMDRLFGDEVKYFMYYFKKKEAV